MQHELVLYVIWYNLHRPHSAFMRKQNRCEVMGPRTPQEVYEGVWESNRQNAPPDINESSYNCELPPIEINISYFEGRRHLPVIEIKKASDRFREAA